MQFLGLLVTAGTAVAISGKATTTRYYDSQVGACGCGSDGTMFSWQTGGSGFYTAAGSNALFAGSNASSTWCGSGCGTCYKLTSTGSSPSGEGAGGVDGQSITVMVTNLCPYSGNQNWCPQSGANDYGYDYHFDIMAQSEVFGDNVIVNFEETSCPSAASSDYEQCQCGSGS